MKRGNVANRLLDYYLGIPFLNLFASFTRKRSPLESPTRIGVLFNPALGDTLIASAAMQDIRSLYPQARLIVFATSANHAAAKLLPEVDAIEVLSLTSPFKAIRILRRNHLDMMVDFTAWQRVTAFYTLACGAKFKIGFKREAQYRHRGYDRAIEHRGDCHEVENLRRLTRSLGARTHAAPRLLLPSIALPQGVSPTDSFIVFHPWASGARSWMREWPDERWVRLARELKSIDRLKDCRVFITGAPSDEPRCQALLQQMNNAGIDAQVLIGRNGIGEVAHVLRRARLLVSVNTGIMHLGAIVGAPTISINGPTSSLRWGPVGQRVANVVPPDGSGGYLDLGFEYEGRTENVMERIQVDEVRAAAEQLVGNTPAQ